MIWASAAAGAGGALVRSILGWAKSQEKFQVKQVVESVIEGAIAGMFLPDPISAAVAGYIGSDAAGKILRTIPGVKRAMPQKD